MIENDDDTRLIKFDHNIKNNVIYWKHNRRYNFNLFCYTKFIFRSLQSKHLNYILSEFSLEYKNTEFFEILNIIVACKHENYNHKTIFDLISTKMEYDTNRSFFYFSGWIEILNVIVDPIIFKHIVNELKSKAKYNIINKYLSEKLLSVLRSGELRVKESYSEKNYYDILFINHIELKDIENNIINKDLIFPLFNCYLDTSIEIFKSAAKYFIKKYPQHIIKFVKNIIDRLGIENNEQLLINFLDKTSIVHLEKNIKIYKKLFERNSNRNYVFIFKRVLMTKNIDKLSLIEKWSINISNKIVLPKIKNSSTFEKLYNDISLNDNAYKRLLLAIQENNEVKLSKSLLELKKTSVYDDVINLLNMLSTQV